MSRDRVSVLWRIGRRIAKESEAAALRRVVLTIAVTCLVLGGVAVVAVFGLNAARENRAAETGLYYAEGSVPADETTLVDMSGDSAGGSRSFGVVYFDPLGPRSPVPNGLPGEGLATGDVYLSPELQRLHPDLAERYGTFAGRIETHGLIDPGELLVYVVADLESSPGATTTVAADAPAASNSPYATHIRLTEQDFAPSAVAVLLLVLVVIPASMLAVVAARIGGEARDRRMAVLAVLGARRRDRICVALAESLGPLAAGLVLAGAVTTLFLSADLRLPYVRYLVSSADLRDLLGILMLTATAAGLAALGLATAGAYAGGTREKRTRPQTNRRVRAPRLWIVLFLVALVVSLAAPTYAYGGPQFYTAVWISMLALVATIAPAVTAASFWIARRTARAVEGLDRPVSTLISRRVAASPKPFGRPLAAVALANLLIVLIATLNGLLNETGYEVKRWFETSPRSMVFVHGVNSVGQESAAWREALPPGLESVAIRETESTTAPGYIDIALFGDCTTAALNGYCDTATAPAALAERFSVNGNHEVAQAVEELAAMTEAASLAITDYRDVEAAQGNASYIVFDPQGGQVDSAAVKAAGTMLPAGAQVLYPGEAEILGTIPNGEHSRWVTGIGALGISLLGFAMVVAFATVFGREARRLAPLSMMTGDRTVYRKLALGSVAVPIIIATAFGIVIGQVATTPLRRYIETPTTPMWTAVLLAVNAAAAAAVAVWASKAVLRYRDRWKPSNH